MIAFGFGTTVTRTRHTLDRHGDMLDAGQALALGPCAVWPDNSGLVILRPPDADDADVKVGDIVAIDGRNEKFHVARVEPRLVNALVGPASACGQKIIAHPITALKES